MTVWILTGNEQNWEHALNYGGIWGVRPNLERQWEKVNPGDRVYFYCKAPVAGVIGFGTVRTKFKQNRPFWPDEVEKHSVIYPYRFEFDVDFLLPKEKWASQAAKGSAIGLTRIHIAAGLNVLKHEGIVKRLNEMLAAPRRMEYRERELSHDSVKQMLYEIGRFQRYISDMEYPMDGERLDVVWRRIPRSVPTYVFEVQVRGDVHHALGKLKHAYDLWNSNVFLAMDRREQSKVDSLLSGTFHEIRGKVRTVGLDEVRELYELKRRWREYESRLGISQLGPMEPGA